MGVCSVLSRLWAAWIIQNWIIPIGMMKELAPLQCEGSVATRQTAAPPILGSDLHRNLQCEGSATAGPIAHRGGFLRLARSSWAMAMAARTEVF
jgi:hypothetical protein